MLRDAHELETHAARMPPEECAQRREHHPKVGLVREGAHVPDREDRGIGRPALRPGFEQPLVERVRHDEDAGPEGREALGERGRRDDYAVRLSNQERHDAAQRVSRVRLPRRVVMEIEEVVVELVDHGHPARTAPGPHALEAVQLPLVRPERVALDDEEVAVRDRLGGAVRHLDRVREGRVRERAEQADVRAAVRSLGAVEPVQDVDPAPRQKGPRGCPPPRGRAYGGRRRRSPAWRGGS